MGLFSMIESTQIHEFIIYTMRVDNLTIVQNKLTSVFYTSLLSLTSTAFRHNNSGHLIGCSDVHVLVFLLKEQQKHAILFVMSSPGTPARKTSFSLTNFSHVGLKIST